MDSDRGQIGHGSMFELRATFPVTLVGDWWCHWLTAASDFDWKAALFSVVHGDFPVVAGGFPTSCRSLWLHGGSMVGVTVGCSARVEGRREGAPALMEVGGRRRKERGKENGGRSCEFFPAASETVVWFCRKSSGSRRCAAPAFCGFLAVKVRREEGRRCNREEKGKG
ncbi:hypothetical protein HAX54_043827 [Datura stramonium]|uniref:Uncharacterized protein n=1 Tax=Datura stramonium TaxID=4076 RepID=A0ABS8W643_DATST|nr:hypothetical protein [Datura stramonium]